MKTDASAIGFLGQFVRFWISFTFIFGSGTTWGQVPQPSPVPAKASGWHLADGTSVDEDAVVAILAAHLLAVQSTMTGHVKNEVTPTYKERMKAFPQRLSGANLQGIHFRPLIERAHQVSGVVAENTGSIYLLDLSNCDFERADFSRLYVRECSFAGSNFYNSNCQNSTWDYVDASGTVFSVCRFAHTIREECDLSGSEFDFCDFTEARFTHCKARGADFSNAHFVGAKINDTDMTGATFVGSELVYTEIVGTDLAGTLFERASVVHTLWEPRGQPIAASFASVRDLLTLHFNSSPAGLVTLRKGLQEVGLRDREREVNYVLQRDRINHLWDDTIAHASGEEYVDRWGTRFEKDHRRKTDWLAFVEVAFNKVFFDWPSMYGYQPGRPLRFVVYLSLLCMLPYTVAILRRRRETAEGKHRSPAKGGTPLPIGIAEAGIWAVPLEKRVATTPGDPKRLHVDLAKEGWLKGFSHALALGLFFSAISAFSVGYKDLDVGRWIERIKREESTLRATGWVRTVSGIQALVSFYLLVLWVLTYFGRPFE